MGKKPRLTFFDYCTICDLLDVGKNYAEAASVTGYCPSTCTKVASFRRAVMRDDLDEIVRMKNSRNYSRSMCDYVERRYRNSNGVAPKPKAKETEPCDPMNLILHGLDELVKAMNRIASEMASENALVEKPECGEE